METISALTILLIMLIGHTIADYTPLQNQRMLKAKAEGNLLGIIPHGMWHAFFVGLIVLIFGFDLKIVLIAAIVELIVHTMMDWTKGLISLKIKPYSDISNWRFWTLFGIDQFVHIATKIGIVAWLHIITIT